MTITLPLSPLVGEVFYISNRSWIWTGSSWDSSVAEDFSGLLQSIQVEEAAVLIGTQNVIAKKQLRGQTV
jgi:hypothetical protein